MTLHPAKGSKASLLGTKTCLSYELGLEIKSTDKGFAIMQEGQVNPYDHKYYTTRSEAEWALRNIDKEDDIA